MYMVQVPPLAIVVVLMKIALERSLAIDITEATAVRKVHTLSPILAAGIDGTAGTCSSDQCSIA